jgi:hypothetical protein
VFTTNFSVFSILEKRHCPHFIRVFEVQATTMCISSGVIQMNFEPAIKNQNSQASQFNMSSCINDFFGVLNETPYLQNKNMTHLYTVKNNFRYGIGKGT